MARTSLKPGPGIFTIGSGPLAVQEQLLSLRIEWAENVAGGETRNFMDGTTDTADEDVTHTATVTGTAQQDSLASSGFVAYTWEHAGEEVPFTFQPSSSIARDITGVCKPVPLAVGGDAKVKNTSDFTFRCVGEPVLADV